MAIPTVGHTCMLACAIAALAAASARAADAGPEVVAGLIITFVPQGDKAALVINRGKDHGVAVGDEVRTACRDEIARVTEVYEFRSKLLAPESFVKELGWHQGARVTLHGRASARYCPEEVARQVRMEDRLYVTEVVKAATQWELKLDKGERSGIAVGDEVRFSCVDGLVARVARVEPWASWAVLPREAIEDACRLTVAAATLRGMESSPYCAKVDPNLPAPVRLEALVTKKVLENGWWRLELDRGAEHGVKKRDIVQLPCGRVEPFVDGVYDVWSVVGIEDQRWETIPDKVWINLNGTANQPFCFRTAETCREATGVVDHE